MAGTVTLKANPKEIENQAKNLEAQIKKVEKLWGNIEKHANKMNGYWEGDANSKHQKDFKKVKEDMEKTIRRLWEHPDDLRTIAGVYKSTEKANKELAAQLPVDLIN